jgi:SET domain-containing protein 6
LRERLGENDWVALGSAWEPLIVAMMWEESRGVGSPWHGYLKDLPNQFDTLMFWSEEELALLQASTIKGQYII